MTAIDLSAFTSRISDRELEQLCLDNPETRFETTKEGKLVAMAPTGGLTGEKNSSLLIQVGIWNLKTKLGLDKPTSLSGEDILPDLSVNLLEIF